MAASKLQIGRFHVVKVLGEGTQGKVYLAEDPKLGRQVAIKTVKLDPSQEREKQIKILLDEARIVSRMQHPNIVTLYDAGEDQNEPYLVFEYVPGMTLSERMQWDGLVEKTQAVELTLQILAGVAFAHGKGVVHRDLKPSNIILDSNSVPRIMDFGIARQVEKGGGKVSLMGTPLYLAPETVGERIVSPRSDVFSVGMILFEMLTGRNPVRAPTLKEVLERITRHEIPAPSSLNPAIDERLDSIVLRALARNADDRYQSASQMAEALEAYLRPETNQAQSTTGQSTLDFLLRRMRHKSDFPAISQSISAINQIVSSDSDSVADLSNVILRDFSLTNKLLKLVNTAFYGQFGGSISTISRAIVILGFDTVRNIAVSLMLFEHLQNKSQAQQLKDQVIATFFTGLIGRELAIRTKMRDVEEALICAMFHNLGKLLATFYFHEEVTEIEKLVASGTEENRAVLEVLGTGYQELGVGVARTWHFPDKIITSMREVTDEKVKAPQTDAEKLRVIAGLSKSLVGVAGNTDPQQKHLHVQALVSRYGVALGVTDRTLTSVVEESMNEFRREASVLEVNAQESIFLGKVTKWSGTRQSMESSAGGKTADTLSDTLKNTVLVSESGLADVTVTTNGIPANAQSVLAAGIQDITSTLVDDYSLNDLLRMILETMYRGMNFSRVVLCIRDAKQNCMNARFGFGKDIGAIIPKFRFALSGAPNVFQIALMQALDIHIEDINAANIRDRIPQWYRDAIDANSFILFPLVIDKKPVGLLYADRQGKEGMIIPQKELSLLKTLRNQAVLAIKQKM